MKYITAIFLSILVHITYAQETNYSSPVKIPLFLSGSFAELRSNHFHSGIDIKTRGVTGIPVYTVADGHISRIVVSPAGYGLALYIDHPNGTTSVYGHLERFRDDIARYVKDIQYERESFRVDLSIPKNTFPLKKDEFIAYSGNSGSSGGPHLHFEIRDSKTQEPLNPLHFSFPVKDNIPPRIYSLMIVPLNPFAHVDFHAEKRTWPVVYENGRYLLKNNPIIPVYGMIGFAIEGNDFFDGSNNKCGIYSIKMYWDGELFYSFRMDRFSFDETRYLNSHIDYEAYIHTGSRYHKTWTDPGNRLRIYDYLRSNGAVRVTDGNIHFVKIELADLQGNKSVLDFRVESKYGKVEQEPASGIQLLKFDQANRFRKDSVRIDFQKETFYTDVDFIWRTIPSGENLLSDIHVIHKTSVPLHKSANLSVRTETVEQKHREKALLVRVDTLSGKIASAGGVYRNGWVTGDISTFGNYAVALDTLPPRIEPLSIRDRSSLTETSRIRFRISDDLSGVKNYTGTINEKWALFEYDAKTNMLTHYFDPDRFDFGKRHRLVLTVTDNKDNTNTYEASFWK